MFFFPNFVKNMYVLSFFINIIIFGSKMNFLFHFIHLTQKKLKPLKKFNAYFINLLISEGNNKLIKET